MKLSRKQKRKLKKRLLEVSMSSIAVVLMLIAGSKLAGISMQENISLVNFNTKADTISSGTLQTEETTQLSLTASTSSWKTTTNARSYIRSRLCCSAKRRWNSLDLGY